MCVKASKSEKKNTFQTITCRSTNQAENKSYCTVVHDGLVEGCDFGDMRSRVETMFESQEVEVEWDE